MKKTLLIIALFSLVISSSFAQKGVNKATFNELVNKITYDFVNMSIEDTKDDARIKAFKKAAANCVDQKTNKCCSDECNKAILKYLKKAKITSTYNLALSIDSTKLKYNDKLAPKDQYALISKIFTENTKVQSFKGNRSDNPEPSNTMIANLDQQVNTIFKIEKKTTTDSAASKETTDNKEKESSSGGSSILVWALLLAGILAFVGYFLPKTKKEKATLSNKIRQLEGEVTTLKNDVKTAKSNNKDLTAKNKVLFASEEALRQELERIKKIAAEGQKQRAKAKVVIKQPRNKEGQIVYDTFFMPVPNREGHFDNDNKSNSFDWTENVYKFEVTSKERDVAMFSFVNHEKMIQRALNNYNTYIAPACTAENRLNLSATQIHTIKKGKVVLENGVWQLERKVKIRYES